MHFDQKISLDKGKTSRSPWFYISRHCVLIYNNININIGDGENTSFWDDVWKGDIANKILFPRLYNIAKSKTLSIKEVWDEKNGYWDEKNGYWNLCLRRNLKDDEIDEWIFTSTFLIIALTIGKIAGFGIQTVLESLQLDPYYTIYQSRTPRQMQIFTNSSGHRLV